MARLLLLSAALCVGYPAVASGRQLEVFGYVPEYRFGSVDWRDLASQLTHLVLFSVEPTADGDLRGFDRLAELFKAGSGLRAALSELGDRAPKLLFTIGGAGRSQHFGEALGNKKSRKKLAKLVATVFDKLPFLSGVDLDWETPQTPQHWRDLGKLATSIRGSTERKILLTTTYHPRTGAVDTFATLKAKSGGSFLDLFDFVHGMAYTQFDPERRHSSQSMDKAAIDEWIGNLLPPEKMTLGMPFFGVRRKSGEAVGYATIIDSEPSLADRQGTDESKDGVYFINARSAAQKVQVATNRGLGGVMIWEVGQDKPVSSGAALLPHVWTAAREGMQPEKSLREMVLTKFHGFGEDQAIGVLATIIGAYLLVKVFTVERPRDRLQPPPPPPKKSKPTANGHDAAAEGADGPKGAEAEPAEADPSPAGEEAEEDEDASDHGNDMQ